MQTIKHGYEGLALLADLNWDRFVAVFMIVGSLMLGGLIATL